jgi:hypothetical protein
MRKIDVTLQLPEALVEKARANGLLSNERIAMLLQSEVERIESWQALNTTLEPVRAAFRADHPDMTDEDVIDMVYDIMHEDKDTGTASKT